MPFEARSVMSQKEEFVRLALAPGANVSALCRRFGIGRTCGHKLLSRYRMEGAAGLAEQSRRPLSSPARSAPEVEAAAVSVRVAHPAWGGRKIARVLAREGIGTPAASTVTGILRRNGIELGALGGGAQPFIRFEHAAPNHLWQMDFKGHVALRAGRLHPLTVLDDHSRFSIALSACADQTTETVKARLIAAFRRYGLPWRIATDNGPPWGDGGRNDFTLLTVWLIEIGIAVSHSRPCHPQTLGKDERFHRSLKAEALQGPPFANLAEAQDAFDQWRHVYNAQRPHDALGGGVPLDRYQASPRQYRETVEPFEYAKDDLIRRVQQHGFVSILGRTIRLCRAFAGKSVAFRPTATDGVFDAWFRHQKIETIDLNALAR
ncbi:IS481 family transposase [Mesorhizobium sp. M1E.F.Ca.ET.045.02.1.1]|uniref:IS481 family transposase n=3 Tax=Mesorhizobium TaxID=68287 RepID=UPI000F764DEB|nr:MULTISPECIES: IS481 family transposase [unclassified Mesorhizobium]AZO20938.1 IS481 family transposase [Mesorhizobium sp. M1E.F.Ca.ET.045.02.1.1]AZO22149.1 IS481 family transposase [Mesorhizobium sp. M1E.F.Ca.ET.045.02.1.1]AZO23496.1 IS481 family transposase [Mesorhizobium sp. M1E.F.Ca.ET.045.02.1.1]AZO24893.1 IS481 family transposase [Mesorhizobium sp. M1E.F.Ca.ET.045.02.1.1]AZO25079.1 IS481 family transposase [Mesorhizobium sp. M1E.F.Ca.ET.045.02.1.1]